MLEIQRRDRALVIAELADLVELRRLPASRPLLANPVIVSLMKGIIRRLPNVQLNSTQAIAVGPGETRQNLHRDRWPWGVLPLPDDFEYLVNCMWALTDFTIALVRAPAGET